jgi:hypothetical protein
MILYLDAPHVNLEVREPHHVKYPPIERFHGLKDESEISAWPLCAHGCPLSGVKRSSVTGLFLRAIGQPSLFGNLWRFRAEEVRTIADDMKVIEAKAIMIRIAKDYERIANLVEQWSRERKQD